LFSSENIKEELRWSFKFREVDEAVMDTGFDFGYAGLAYGTCDTEE
jgi:hypothetical protein